MNERGEEGRGSVLTVFEFCLISIAVFRLTHLLVFDDITSFIRRPFLSAQEEKGENGETILYVSQRVAVCENGLVNCSAAIGAPGFGPPSFFTLGLHGILHLSCH